MRRLRTFARLSWGERWLVMRLIVLLAGVGAALMLFGYKRVHSVLGRWMRSAAPVPDAEAFAQAKLIGQRVRFAAKITHATCLPRALALWWMLARRGIESALRIGVRIEDGVFKAHAWVEVQGRVVNDRPDVRQLFTPFEADMADRQIMRVF